MFDNKRKFSFKVDGMFVEFNRDKDEYFITFIDGTGNKKRSEIPIEIANLYLESKIYERKHEQIWTRHIEHFDLSNDEIYRMSISNNEPLHDEALRNIKSEELHRAINKLPPLQKERLEEYYFTKSKCTQMQLAKEKGISVSNIKASVKQARDNLKNFLKKFNF